MYHERFSLSKMRRDDQRSTTQVIDKFHERLFLCLNEDWRPVVYRSLIRPTRTYTYTILKDGSVAPTVLSVGITGGRGFS
jgi:hypothetical protein